MGDRGGGREVKGASLRTSKKNPGRTGRSKTSLETAVVHTYEVSLPPPAVTCQAAALNFDCGVALLSRQFDRDREKVLQRARTEGSVAGMVLWSSNFENQEAVAALCKAERGTGQAAMCYFVCGVHPDNVSKSNMDRDSKWIQKIQELACASECVGVLSGLSMSREYVRCSFFDGNLH